MLQFVFWHFVVVQNKVITQQQTKGYWRFHILLSKDGLCPANLPELAQQSEKGKAVLHVLV